MTTIKIHGLLSKTFGTTLKIHLGKTSDILNAIDSIKSGFRNKLIEFQKKSLNYTFKKINNFIYITPVILGCSFFSSIGNAFKSVGKAVASGFKSVAHFVRDNILPIAIAVIGIALMFVPGLQSIGLSLIFTGLSMALFKPPKMGELSPQKGASGGATYAVESTGKSYVFSNAQNVATQGNIVRIGYGKFLTSSSIISVGVKNFSTNQTFERENYFIYNEPAESRFSAEFDATLAKLKNVS